MVQPQIIDERNLTMDSVTIGYAKQHTKKLGTHDFWKGIAMGSSFGVLHRPNHIFDSMQTDH